MDLMAAFISLLGCFLVATNGQYSRFAFPLFIVGNSMWMYVGIHTGVIGTFIANLGYLLINLFAIKNWYKKT